MASLTTHKLYIDLMSGNAYKGWNNFNSVGSPVFYYGSRAQVEMYLVRQTTSASYPMESVDFPSSTITVRLGTPGSANIEEDTTWSAISAPTATWSSPLLTIPKAAIAGYYTLTLSNASPSLSATTIALTINSTSADISYAIVAAVNGKSGWSNTSAKVTQTGDGKYTISAYSTNSSTIYTLTVSVTSALTGPSGYVGIIPMSDTDIGTALGSAESIESHIQVISSDGTGTQTFLQIPCVIRNKIT